MPTIRIPSCSRGDRALGLFAAVVCLLGVATTPAAAATAFGLTTGNQIVAFDTATPGTPIGTVAITGLQAGENALGIDLRPATGQIYLLGSTSRLYTVNPTTGVAVAVGAGAFTPALSGTTFGFDFNPVVDRVRIVSDTGQNLRVHPETGVAIADAALNPGTPHLAGSAYENNVAGSGSTVLYGIDAVTDQLVVQNPPNNGTLVPQGGPLGVDTSDDVGFDISANDRLAYATLTVAGTTRLYTINLLTGAATQVAPVVGGPYRGLTVLSRGVPLITLLDGSRLVRLHSSAPGVALGLVPITGLQGGETIVGIDVRPANGMLYGVGSTSRLYVLNPVSGAATAVGVPFTTPLSGTRFGVDFNPVADRLRVVSDAQQNLRINPDTGVVVVDTPLNPAGTVTGSAYVNSVDGAATTALYGIDAGTDQLVIQNPPNNGTLTAVGPLGVNTSSDLGFDISPLDNVGFAALTINTIARLYTVNLVTGATLELGSLSGGAGTVTGLAVMPQLYAFAEGSTGTFFDTDFTFANPAGSATVPVTITYLTESGRSISSILQLAPRSRTTVSADADPLLGATAFSATIDSPLGFPIAVERTMRWDPTGYGMHTEKAVNALSRTWFFAEGSQGFFDTFFLLTNPAPVANTASLRFLLENGTVVTRSYNLAARSRLTIHTGQVAELINQSFATAVTFAIAGGAERAMYFGSPTFNGGHESAGVAAPATEWFLAEGATGSFFTTFVLVANPGSTPANVTLTYLREGGGSVTRNRTLAPSSRVTINLALEDATLASTSAATRVISDVPIVVERAQYWPFSPAQWNEAHNAFGVTETARSWGLAEGRVGGPFAFQTFVLLANPDPSQPASVTATFLRTSGAPVVKNLVVPANGRLTVTTGPGSMVPELADESFGVTVTADRPVFAERALYSNAADVLWAAGSSATASPLLFVP